MAATMHLDEEGFGERLTAEAIRTHMHDQAEENLRLKELLDKLDDQGNRHSELKELLEELEDLVDDSSTVEGILDAVSNSQFEQKLALIQESRVFVEREQELQKARIAQRTMEFQSDFEQIIDQMQQAHEDAILANKCYWKVLQFIDATCNLSQDYEFKELESIVIAPLPSCCELSLNKGRPEPESVSDPRKSPKDFLNMIDKSPKRLSISDVIDCIAEHHYAHLDSSSPGMVISTPLQILSSKSDSSSNSSSSCGSVNATPRFGIKGSKAITKKSPSFVPRLDLSWIRSGVETSSTLNQLQQKPFQLLCDEFENPSRGTSKRTDSARLISLTDADDHFGGSIDSARTMLLRIKRRAKGGSCGGEASGPINGVNVRSGGGHYNFNNIMKKPPEEVVHGALVTTNDLQCEPTILDIGESVAIMESIHESVSTETTYKDEGHQIPIHEVQRAMNPPFSKVNHVMEMPMPCDGANVAENTPTKAKKKIDGDLTDLEVSRQEKRIQILLWSTNEKLLTLQTLNNTMFLWEDKPAKCGSFTSILSDENIDLVLSSLTAAKESQRKLFDFLDGVQGILRCTICCSAIRELVRAYPPERLVPTLFINDHFVTKFLQETVIDESSLKLVSANTLRSTQDSEAAKFWQALVHHVVSVVDHKITTIEESAKDFAEVLLHEMQEADTVRDAKLARFELQSFLTRCFKMEPASISHILFPQEEEYDTTEELLPISDTARTHVSLAPSQTEEVASDRQVRDIIITHGKKSKLPLVAAKHSKKSSLSIFNSLKFWKRKPPKIPAMDIDYFSMLNLDYNTNKSEHSRRGNIAKQYGFSLNI